MSELLLVGRFVHFGGYLFHFSDRLFRWFDFCWNSPKYRAQVRGSKRCGYRLKISNFSLFTSIRWTNLELHFSPIVAEDHFDHQNMHLELLSSVCEISQNYMKIGKAASRELSIADIGSSKLWNLVVRMGTWAHCTVPLVGGGHSIDWDDPK